MNEESQTSNTPLASVTGAADVHDSRCERTAIGAKLLYGKSLCTMANAWIWATDVSDYNLCPWRVYYKRVKAAFVPSTALQSVGWLFHQGWERFYGYLAQQASIGRLTYLEIESLADRSVREALDWGLLGFEIFPKTLRDSIPTVRASLVAEGMRLAAMQRRLGVSNELLLPVEMEARYLHPEMRLTGRIDLVYRSSTGLEPWEIKTGQPSERRLRSYVLQVTTYAVLLERNTGSLVERAGIRFPDRGLKYSFKVTSEARQKVCNFAISIRHMFQTGDPPLNSHPDLPYCEDCSAYWFATKLTKERG